MHTRVPFDKLEKELYELSEILKQFEIATSKKSSLESIILESTKLRDQYEANSAIDLHFDIRPVYRNLLGIHDFVDKFLKVKNHPGFQALKPHVALLETSLAAGQNIKAPVTDGDANKLFELYIALAIMRFSQTVTLDNPNFSKGDNPDILFDYSGVTAGIACKALHSENKKSLLDNLTKGLQQIEVSPASLGLVIVTIKNCIKHDEFWKIENPDDFAAGAEPEYESYPSLEVAQRKLQEYGEEYRNFLSTVPSEELLHLFENKKTPPEIYLFLNSTCGLRVSNQIEVTNIKYLLRIAFTEHDPRFKDTREIARDINEHIQYGT